MQLLCEQDEELQETILSTFEVHVAIETSNQRLKFRRG